MAGPHGARLLLHSLPGNASEIGPAGQERRFRLDAVRYHREREGPRYSPRGSASDVKSPHRTTAQRTISTILP